MSTMASSNRKLLAWFTSRNPLHVFIKILPLVALLIYILVQYHHNVLSTIIALILGIISWSLLEYVIHRWIYHQHYKNRGIKWFIDSFHIHHHQHLDDYEVLNAGFLLVYPIFFLFGFIAFLFTQSIVLAAAFCLGMILYYFFYENIHYFIHYKTYQSGYMRFIQQYHLFHHHAKWNKNYGNTTSIWDRIFGTYDKAYKNFTLSESNKVFLISHKKEAE